MDLTNLLEARGIQPSAQRLAVARYVLSTEDHPSADQVFARVAGQAAADGPVLSRATVYNTLNLFVEKGLLKPLVLSEGRVVFDPNLSPHHHFIDDDTGIIHDVPWDALRVRGVEELEGFDVTEHQVVLRGRAKKKKR